MSLSNKVYLDNAACEPPCKSVLQNLTTASIFFNPSAQYESAGYNRRIIESVREKIAKEINADPEEIIFTSCASESNTLAIDGFYKKHGEDYYYLCSDIEHSSILNNKNIKSTLPCPNGVIDLDFVEDASKNGWNNVFCSLMLANNEIGSIQPVKEFCQIVHEAGENNVVHCDATAAFGKIKIDVKDLGVDMLTASAQKIGGIKGAAFLYVRKGVKLDSIIVGEQENGLRGGTYNEFAIKMFGFAIDEIDYKKDLIAQSKRNFLFGLLSNVKGVHINGSIENRLSNNINIRIDDLAINNQQVVALLDEAGFMCSAGSACNSGEPVPSHVLKAIGLTDEEAMSSIRITINSDTSVRDLEDFVDALKSIMWMNKK